MTALKKEDILKRINDLIEPEASPEARLPKLLELLASQGQGYMPPQPVGESMPIAEATPENIAASIGEPTPETPAFMKYPFIKGKK